MSEAPEFPGPQIFSDSYLKFSGGISGICISIFTFDGSIFMVLSIQYVTDVGQKITIITRMTIVAIQGIAPQ
jgi:hypothetical protein